MANKLIVALAGSGKTTRLVGDALHIKNDRILITTFTQANELEIKKKFIERVGCVPENITIQTWFSFLMQHGIRPYQSYLYDEKIEGLLLVNEKSGFRFRTNRGIPIYWGEDKVKEHYLTKNNSIYSDKLSKFVIRCDEASDGMVFKRLDKIFSHIFVDEVQDLAGYDLEVLKCLMQQNMNVCMVGDPRQVTYTTHFEAKHKKYRNGKIKAFIENECKKLDCEIDELSLSVSYRNKQDVCDLSSQLYAEYGGAASGNLDSTGHDGLFFITEVEVRAYLDEYRPIQLRLRRDSKGPQVDYPVYNFGDSKGLTFDRILIYPTNDMKLWLKDHSKNLSDKTRAQLYVALTRAKHSVAIYLPDEDTRNYSFLQPWKS